MRSERRYDLLRALRDYPQTNTAYPFGESIHVTDRRTDTPGAVQQSDLRAFLDGRGFADAHIDTTAPTVEDTFMARMGGSEEAA